MKHPDSFTKAGLIGKAGEMLVAAELLRRGVDVTFPALDAGVDLFAYSHANPSRMVPVQVKAWSGAGYTFTRSWFKVPGLVLVQVFHAAVPADGIAPQPLFYIYRSGEDVEAALGSSADTVSWRTKGHYSATPPISAEMETRRQPFIGKWDYILDQL